MRKPEKDDQVPSRALLFFMLLTGLAFFSIAEAQSDRFARIIITFEPDYTSKIEQNPEEYLSLLKEITGQEVLTRAMSFPGSWVITVKPDANGSTQKLINQLTAEPYIHTAEPDYSISR